MTRMNLKALVIIFYLLIYNAAFAGNTVSVGKPVYCDTSAGRLVLNNGDYSQAYCRYTAVMELESLHGCCSWSGGIMLVKNGAVVCRDGSLSPVCSLQGDKKDFQYKSDDSVTMTETPLS